MIDEYRKGWALRYLREAVDEIKIVKKDVRAINLAIDALRKAQAAVYYSLGEPFLIEMIVEESINSGLPPNNPILRYLIDMEKSIKRLEQQEFYGDTATIEEIDRIISLASKIVNLLTSLED